ncbi:YoaK family protein [Acidovorax sp. Leaf160]|uniref:YoaK family protein n=1 Tax=Acidovorax sp. Leaf160 TaxID=1736280 RepID=UPI0009E68093|nr:YoaK family protein [Acidovorax sp. Leaf160]
MRLLRHLTGLHRTRATNRVLGLLLAFIAGAVNAGGFLVLARYTSHMTGFTSQVADSLVTGDMQVLLGALGAILAFLAGAATAAIQINWGRQFGLRHLYALPLLLEAALMLPFGLMGALTLGWSTPFAVPLTVLLLSFIMGVQNAVASKVSGGKIRTTHMTGHFTDLGIELGKALYWNRFRTEANRVRPNLDRVRLFGGLIAAFVLGGVAGAAGFKHVGFVCVLPLAALLLWLSLPAYLDDLRHNRALRDWTFGWWGHLRLRHRAPPAAGGDGPPH